MAIDFTEGKKIFYIPQDEYRKKLGERLAKVREYYGITQAKMAQELEISKANLFRLEKGEVVPNAIILKNLSTVFEVSIDWLLNGDGQMIRKKGMVPKTEWDFGKDEPFMRKFIEVMYKVPMVRYEMLLHYNDYFKENEEAIRKTLDGYNRYQEKFHEKDTKEKEVGAVSSSKKEDQRFQKKREKVPV